ncbi:MAG: tubulin-like doman-containing protein [Gemmataceae bacterium]|nr:tubulin-like doman-containing protein [Gemmataceae bacterium]
MANESTTTAPEQVASYVAPTLLIGLGGTGKDVLLRIRRMFYERHGKRADGSIGFPIVGYLALDTDPGAFERLEGDSPSDFVMRTIQFKRGGTPEAIDCTVEPRQLEDYFRGGEQSYPHLFRWLPHELKRFGANGIVGGAGQNRLFGRLAFFHHYPTIASALKARIHQIVTDATLPQRREQWLGELRRALRVNPRRLEIVLVYSLAGGTGAGMFLDMGFLVRHIVERELNLPDVQPFFTHFAIMPEAFVQEAAEGSRNVVLTPDQRRKIQENAFACLREMEYFSLRPGRSFDLSIPPSVSGHQAADLNEPWYRVQWALDGPWHEVHSSPWDTCYLVGAGNDTMGSGCLPPSEIYQMVADRLFLHFDGGQFAMKDHSERSNIVDRTLHAMRDKVRDSSKDRLGDVLYSHYLSKRFSTFGLAEIYFDRERMRRAAAHRLAYKLVSEWWLREPDKAPVELARLAAEDLAGGAGGQAAVVTPTGQPGDPQIGLTYSALRNQILLENREVDRRRTWFQVVQDEENARKRDIESGRHDTSPFDALRPFVQQQTLRLKRDRFSKGETGLAIRSFEGNRKLLEPEIDARLRCLFLYRLDHLGVRGAQQLFEEYTNLYRGEIERAGQMVELTRSAMPPWEDRVADAQKLPLAAYARTAVRFELLRAARLACEHMQKAFHHEAIPDIRLCLEQVQKQLSPGDRARSYADRLHHFHDALSAQTDTVTGVRHYLARRFHELREPGSPYGRTVGLLDHLSEAEYDSALRQMIAPQGRSAGLDMAEVGPTLERRVLEQLRTSKEAWKDVHSLGDLALKLVRDGELPAQPVVDELARDLAEACEGLLAGFAGDTSALHQFNKDADRKKVRLDCLRIYSGVFLRIARTGDTQEIDAPSIKRLGIASCRSPGSEAFRRELEAGGGHGLVGLQPFDIEDDTVVVYQEKTGIPLCYYQELEGMARHYYESQRQKETHFDYNALRGRLPDIRRVDQDRQKHLANCLELTLYGIITGVLSYREERGQRCFWLESRSDYGGSMLIPLGEQFETVVNRLAEHEGDRADLQAQLNSWFTRAAAKQEGQQIVLLWCALQDLYDLVHRRIAERVARAGPSGQKEERNHPMYRILEDRMLAAVFRRVQGLPSAGVWLSSKLDLSAILRELEGEERAMALQMRRELLEDCFRPVNEGLPIPVIQPRAQLEEKVFGDLLRRRDPARRGAAPPPLPLPQPPPAPAARTPPPVPEENHQPFASPTPTEDAGPFRFTDDYEGDG